MLRNLRAAFIVASATMPEKKRFNSSSSDKKSNKVPHPTAPTSGTPGTPVPLAPPAPSKTPAPDEQADGSPKPTDTNADKPAKQSRNGDQPQAAKTDTSLRTYSIPDYRLERPEFRIFMCGRGIELSSTASKAT